MLRNDPELSGRHVLAAVSGGADSVAMLLLLARWRDEGRIRLSAAHFEHGIRGEASREDMEYVRRLCRDMNVPLTVGCADVPEEAAKAHEGLEACARRLRHAFLEKTRSETGADVIALAHHRRDKAETVLMHLLRGSGSNGAAAMPYRSGHVIRPLIDAEPGELKSLLAENGIAWREDETNRVPDNPRNFLRLRVFPLLEEIYPGCVEALCRFSEISAEENRLLDRLTREYIACGQFSYAGVHVLSKQTDKAILRRAVCRLLPEAGFEHVERALSPGHKSELPGFWQAGEDENYLYLLPPIAAPDAVPLSNGAVLEGICSVLCEPCAPEPIRNNGLTQVLRSDALAGAVLRTRREGDFIRPFGMNGKRKSLGDYLTDRGFPLLLRDRLPLLAVENEILWVPSVGISQAAAVVPDKPASKLTINISGGYQP